MSQQQTPKTVTIIPLGPVEQGKPFTAVVGGPPAPWDPAFPTPPIHIPPTPSQPPQVWDPTFPTPPIHLPPTAPGGPPVIWEPSFPTPPIYLPPGATPPIDPPVIPPGDTSARWVPTAMGWYIVAGPYDKPKPPGGEQPPGEAQPKK